MPHEHAARRNAARRFARIFAGTLGAVASISGPSGAAIRTAPHSVATCATAVVFDQPDATGDGVRFRATVEVACPPGVAFSAALRSAHGCDLQSAAGTRMHYEMFADRALGAAVISCERPTRPLTGSGRRTFLIYGRIDGTAAAGRFTDELLSTIER